MKKEKRSLKELYTILLHYCEKKKFFNRGICLQIGNLASDRLINYREQYYLKENLLKNKPNLDQHSEFVKHKSYIIGFVYWWKEGEEEQRLLFIKKMIEIN